MLKIKFLSIALLIGILNAVILIIFEFIVTEGTDYLWNDFFNTDENRLMLIPVAILLSIIYSSVIFAFKQKRIGHAETNLLEDEEVKKTTFNNLATIFIIGSVSLLAGASLGPEASLVGIASGVGIWFAEKSKNMYAAKLLVLSSIGALLVAFLGSPFPILIPILMLYKKEKKIVIKHIIPPIVAGLASYVTLILIKGEAAGYTIPLGNTYMPVDILGAVFLGFLGAVAAILIKNFIKRFENLTEKINSKTHWVVTATILGAIIGIFYLIGGPTIEFSGREGTNLLLQTYTPYSIFALIVIVLAKLLVTSWSLSAGYRGGLVFPSVFIAVTLSLILTKIDPALGGPGIIIGSVAGMLTAMVPPILGFILVIGMIPAKFIGIAVAGLVGALLGTKTINKYLNKKNFDVI